MRNILSFTIVAVVSLMMAQYVADKTSRHIQVIFAEVTSALP